MIFAVIACLFILTVAAGIPIAFSTGIAAAAGLLYSGI